MIKHLSLLIIFSFLSIGTFAQQDNDIITLTVDGIGNTKDNSILNALRNAIEQAYGTFISSKTIVENDKLLLDEIITVSQGNIIDFEIMSSINVTKDQWYTTLQATVSVNELAKICESKGMSVDYTGKIFAANLKLFELNRQNEGIIMNNLCLQAEYIVNNSFDFIINADNPIASSAVDRRIVSFSTYYGRTKPKFDYAVKFTIEATINDNIIQIPELVVNTIRRLSISESERLFLDNSKTKYSCIEITYYKSHKKKNILTSEKVYLRNVSSLQIIEWINKILLIKGSKRFIVSNSINSSTADDIFYCTYDDYKCANESSFIFFELTTNHPFLKSKIGAKDVFYHIPIDELIYNEFTMENNEIPDLKTVLIIREVDMKYRSMKEQRHWASSITHKNMQFNSVLTQNDKNYPSGSVNNPLRINYTNYLKGFSFRYTFYDLLYKDEISKITEYSVTVKN